MYKIVWMSLGALAFAGAVIGFIILHRRYKSVGRRCLCGRIDGIYHVSRITFPPGEEFNPRELPILLSALWLDLNLEGIKNFYQNYRWWFQNAQMVTFSVCPHCKRNNGNRRVKVVTISWRQISIWHLYWVHWFYPKQFSSDEEGLGLNQVLWAHNAELARRGHVRGDGKGDPPLDLFDI